ncbi:MAG TPA: cytochrome b/b6 domain-containing protein [Dissulfurispiraceae bacterium]|nr:cytochrome b/b6 domain-containing protein [Dissulfurispiraceae bacterium]
MDAATGTALYIKRFSWYRIIEHWAVAVIFVSLAATGFAQKYYDLALSQWIVLHLGGIDAVRIVHRTAGLFLILALAQHLLAAISGVLFSKWDTSVIITKCDFTDAITNLKYYLGMIEKPARCGRYDYRQKFEYWGILTGSILMGVTGLALWFPTLVIHILPGELIPIAKILHSNEAFVLIMLVTVWHIYNSIFSPEVFPVDTVMFTGKISRERMISEHPVEYEQRFGAVLSQNDDKQASISRFQVHLTDGE